LLGAPLHDGKARSFYFCGAMILSRVGLLLIALSVFCGARAQSSNQSKQSYPAVIKDSLDRRARAEREWRRMLDTYNVPQAPPDFYPITYTPRSLIGVSGGITLNAESTQPAADPLAIREMVRGFIDRWREMIGADSSSLSLASAEESGATRRYVYKQANYAFPIAPPSGEMVIVVSSDGKLMQLDDRLIPVVELPSRPAIEDLAAAKRLVGRVFTYTDLSGKEQRTVINSTDDVAVKQLVILPVEKADAIEVHLAWELSAGNSLTWTVYTDAVTGEDLRVVQNFQT
jgi:hypothetical protein